MSWLSNNPAVKEWIHKWKCEVPVLLNKWRHGSKSCRSSRKVRLYGIYVATEL
jgi:hypothetical protein